MNIFMVTSMIQKGIKPFLSGKGNILYSITWWVSVLKYMLCNSDMSYSFWHNLASAVRVLRITLINNFLSICCPNVFFVYSVYFSGRMNTTKMFISMCNTSDLYFLLVSLYWYGYNVWSRPIYFFFKSYHLCYFFMLLLWGYSIMCT